MEIDQAKIRSAVLEPIQAQIQWAPDGTLLPAGILPRAMNKLTGGHGQLSQDESQALLDAFYGLFQTGHLSWGWNLANAAPPNFHVTDQGRRTLQNLSRDPANPSGYKNYLARQATLSDVADLYVDQALRTYNAACFPASAVMIGGAAETLLLELRDVIVAAIRAVGRKPAKDLNHQNVKRIIDAVQRELSMQQAEMPAELRDDFASYWPAMTQQIRVVRNDAGHPANIARIDHERVYAAFMMFPELAGVVAKLTQWVPTHYGRPRP